MRKQGMKSFCIFFNFFVKEINFEIYGFIKLYVKRKKNQKIMLEKKFLGKMLGFLKNMKTEEKKKFLNSEIQRSFLYFQAYFLKLNQFYEVLIHTKVCKFC